MASIEDVCDSNEEFLCSEAPCDTMADDGEFRTMLLVQLLELGLDGEASMSKTRR